jgi:hypothetical protein
MEKMETLIQEEKPGQSSEATIPVMNWAESEWFQDWLCLARRDYHGRRFIEKPTRKN